MIRAIIPYAIVQLLLAIVVLVMSPMASEMSAWIAIFLMAVAIAAAAGSFGLMARKAWGWTWSIIAVLGFLVPMLVLSTLVLIDRFRGIGTNGDYLAELLIPLAMAGF